MDLSAVVVDGSNIATEGRSTPSLRQLDEAVRAFQEEFPDLEVIVVVDASFGHRIDPSEVAAFDEAVAHSEMVSPPAGAIGRGDAFLLRIAERVGGQVLSNDSFQEFHGEHPWLFDKDRLIGGKPVPGAGWIFTLRNPVRGARSRQATSSQDGKVDAANEVTQSSAKPKIGAVKAAAPKIGAVKAAAPKIGAVKATRTRKAAPSAEPSPQLAPEPPMKDAKAVKAPKAAKAVKAVKTAKAQKTTKASKAPETAKAAKTAKTTKVAKAPKAPEAAPVAETAPDAEMAEAAPAPGTAKAARSRTGASRRRRRRSAVGPEVQAAIDVATVEATTPPDGPDVVSGGGRRRRGKVTPAALNDPLTFVTFVTEHPIGASVIGTVSSFVSHGAMVDVGEMHCYVPLTGLGVPPPRRAREVLDQGESREFVLVGLDAPRRGAELALPELVHFVRNS
jgi:hypothetical protein